MMTTQLSAFPPRILQDAHTSSHPSVGIATHNSNNNSNDSAFSSPSFLQASAGTSPGHVPSTLTSEARNHSIFASIAATPTGTTPLTL